MVNAFDNIFYACGRHVNANVNGVRVYDGFYARVCDEFCGYVYACADVFSGIWSRPP